MDDTPRTFYQVLRLYQLVTDRLAAVLAPAGLTPSQFTVLSMVRDMAPVTSASLARRIGVTAQSAGETVKALTERGLLNRHTAPEHRRLVMLTLSPAGKRTLTRANAIVAAAERELFSCLEPAVFRAFEQSIQRVRAHARAPGPPSRVATGAVPR